VLEALDESQCVLSVFCDLSKAFDCVDHNVLLSKLEYYGIRGTALKWFKSFLSNRKQRVVISGKDGTESHSSWKDMNRGVPQGCILSPILFLIYINDLSLPTDHASLYMYADDVSTLIRESSVMSLIELAVEIMENFEEWFRDNGLILNVKKTQAVSFRLNALGNYISEPIQLRNMEQLPIDESALFLGVTIDASMSWKPQVLRLSRRLSSAAFALSTIKHSCSTRILVTAYRAYFESLLRYGVAFWGDSSLSDKIFKLQKHALRIIFNLRKRDTCKHIFKEQQLLTLPCLYIESLAVLTFQNIGRVQRTGDFHVLNTRHRENISYPIHRTTAFEKGPFYRGLKIYDKLPQEIKDKPSLKLFKRALNTFLCDKAYYTVNEFLNPLIYNNS